MAIIALESFSIGILFPVVCASIDALGGQSIPIQQMRKILSGCLGYCIFISLNFLKCFDFSDQLA